MENKTLINVLLIATLTMYILFFVYLIARYVIKRAPSSVNRDKDLIDKNSIDISDSPYHTEFFNKSVQHANKILFGKEFDPQYGQANYYGNSLIDIIGKLNNETKESTVIAIKYFSIEPSQARQNEQTFRMIAEREQVPLWYVILREAVKKSAPEFIINNPVKEMNTVNNVIPLYQKTG